MAVPTLPQTVQGKMLLTPFQGTKLASECCCEEPCNEVILTVTGNAETIRWCGEEWTVAQSGESRVVCPTFYGLRTTGSDLGEAWTNSGTAYGPNLWMARSFKTSAATLTPSRQENRVLIRPLHESPTLTGLWVPVFWPTSGSLNSYLMSSIRFGLPGTPGNQYYYYFGTGQRPPSARDSTAPPAPTLNDYRIAGNNGVNFGSHVHNGVTYTWAQGAGW